MIKGLIIGLIIGVIVGIFLMITWIRIGEQLSNTSDREMDKNS